MSAPSDVRPSVEQSFRSEWGRLVATAIRIVGDIGRAEELVQEVLLTALERWPESGPPDRPGAWLMTAVRNRAIDELRRQRRTRDKHAELERELTEAVMDPNLDPEHIPDDRLRLIFTCCHPVLKREARVALTLRLLGGLTTPEIARGFLATESAMAQRIVRAKKTLAERQVPYDVPPPQELPARLPAVLEVIYLIFNEGYAARDGDTLLRAGLCEEAIRLAKLVVDLLPAESEAHALLALLEFQASREAARTDESGGLVLLEDQDRSRWDQLRIQRARRHLAQALAAGAHGAYTLQARIARSHALAKTWEETDWSQIAECYDALFASTGSPVVALNRAVAIGMAEGPAAALRLLDALDDEPLLARYPHYPATRADFLRRLERFADAEGYYERALELTTNTREREFLRWRLAECKARITQ